MFVVILIALFFCLVFFGLDLLFVGFSLAAVAATTCLLVDVLFLRQRRRSMWQRQHGRQGRDNLVVGSGAFFFGGSDGLVIGCCFFFWPRWQVNLVVGCGTFYSVGGISNSLVVGSFFGCVSAVCGDGGTVWLYVLVLFLFATVAVTVWLSVVVLAPREQQQQQAELEPETPTNGTIGAGDGAKQAEAADDGANNKEQTATIGPPAAAIKSCRRSWRQRSSEQPTAAITSCRR